MVDEDLSLEGKAEEASATDFAPNLSRVQLNIYPRKALERVSVPENALGLTPGRGKDRTVVYVFYSRVESLSLTQSKARMDKSIIFYASRSKILGTVIAHELGHVLLNLEGHTATGIMRGAWGWRDLKDVALDNLCFSLQQAEAIRTEVQRRNSSAISVQLYSGSANNPPPFSRATLTKAA